MTTDTQPVSPTGSLPALFVLALYTIFVTGGVPLSATNRIGMTVSQLGYLVIGGGALAGSFRIFGLTRRVPTLIVGVALLVCGTILVNR